MRDAVKDRSAYALAADVNVPGPDNLDSPGANWLTRVRDAVIEAVEYAGSATDVDEDTVQEIADGAVEIYTWDRWRVFTDLGMFTESEDILTDLAPDVTDMTDMAGIVQCVIAERLATVLLEELREDEDN